MNKLIIIGNGFDLAHGLPTSYKDFMNWYFEQWRERLMKSYKRIERDELCRVAITDNNPLYIYLFYYNNEKIKDKYGLEFFDCLNSFEKIEREITSPFLSKILDSIETKGWVDIENDYYELLCSYAKERKTEEVKILNRHLSFLKGKLVEYLKNIDTGQMMREVKNVKEEILADITEVEIAEEFKLDCKNLKIERIMLLDFNYTTTTSRYFINDYYYKDIDIDIDIDIDTDIIHIHGKWNDLNSVIFGYGDEMDDRLKDIMRLNDNEYLTNIKSVRYCETDSYKRMLAFMESDYFQACIMGHSCGISDRTLLNAIFEHKKCVSIKPHYRIDTNGNENYSDIIRNIYRNFNNPRTRDRIVSKDCYDCLFYRI